MRAILLSAIFVYAQLHAAEIRGRVLDPSGSAVQERASPHNGRPACHRWQVSRRGRQLRFTKLSPANG